MFTVYCPGHGARVLLDMSRVWRLDGDGDGKGDGGYRLRWICWCGEQGVTKVRHGHPPDQANQPDEGESPPEFLSAS